MRWASCFPLLLLAACSSSKNAPPPPPQDRTMVQHEQAGRLAFDLDRPSEAVAQYQAALRQAEARDDLTAIGDLSFNLAVAQLRANQPEDALTTAQVARAELLRRGSTPFPALGLAEATALYRMGEGQKADSLASEIEKSGNADAASGASFLRGLIADETGDVAGLRDAVARLAGAAAPVREADRLELQARLALRQNDLSSAGTWAIQAAEIRQEILDYRGMARVLAVAGSSAERSGKLEAAADLYLRAGRSAAAQSDPGTARPWLEHVLRLTGDPATIEAAKTALAGLQQ